jgi:hypothetical protein
MIFQKRNTKMGKPYLKNDFNKWDKLPTEKTHLRFCKIYLGVGKKATNIASRELGKYRGTLVKLEQNLPIFNQV